MTNERIPDHTHRSGPSDGDFDRAARLDNEVQPDPQLQEGPAGSRRITLVAIGIAVVLGLVFYGLNNSDMHEASTAPPTQTAQFSTPQANSTARNPNTSPGVTTGAAPTRPTAPAAPKPNPQSGDNPTGQTNPSR